MSYNIFLNFEKLSVQIIEAEIAVMSDNNLSEYGEKTKEIIDDIFMHNLYHGSIAATFIVNLYETALNTIINRRLGCEDISILKASHNDKLQYICDKYHVNIIDIKSDNAYSVTQKIIKLRNDITHFKSNEISKGHFISSTAKLSMGTAKDAISILFTKTYINNCYQGVLMLLEKLCKKCGLVLNMNCEVIDSDGRDELCEFIVTKERCELGKG